MDAFDLSLSINPADSTHLQMSGVAESAYTEFPAALAVLPDGVLEPLGRAYGRSKDSSTSKHPVFLFLKSI